MAWRELEASPCITPRSMAYNHGMERIGGLSMYYSKNNYYERFKKIYASDER